MNKLDYSIIIGTPDIPKYKVEVDYDHGDYDNRTTKTYEFNKDAVDDFHIFLEYLYRMRSFIPDSGWLNLGHYKPIRNVTESDSIIDLLDPKTYHGLYEYAEFDRYYSNYMASIEDVRVFVDGSERLICDKAARSSNEMVMPKIHYKVKFSSWDVSNKSFDGVDDIISGNALHKTNPDNYTIVGKVIMTRKIIGKIYDTWLFLVENDQGKFVYEINGVNVNS